MLHRLLTAVSSLVAEHGLPAHRLGSCDLWALEHRLNSCGSQAQLLRGMWDLPGSGIELVSLALAGGFFTTEPPGKPRINFFFFRIKYFFKKEIIESLESCHIL